MGNLFDLVQFEFFVLVLPWLARRASRGPGCTAQVQEFARHEWRVNSLTGVSIGVRSAAQQTTFRH
ncbi:hypothetical protein [Pseudomonas putida]|uniref:hypothetical protein n=1 Tax=Pseudomonas putida TaxID=303 RepID=UPI00117B4ECE|nr:hypothetical protein [Pseudomonas putida]